MEAYVIVYRPHIKAELNEEEEDEDINLAVIKVLCRDYHNPKSRLTRIATLQGSPPC